MESIRVGLVGSGFIAKQKHLPAWKKAGKGARVVALCDPQVAQAEDLAREHGIPKVYTDFQQMLEAERLDAVDIWSPPRTHADLAVRSLQARSHVLIEKPMAINTQECDQIVAASKENGKKICVAHSDLFYQSFLKARELVSQGIIGEFRGMRIFLSTPTDYITSKPDHWAHRLPGGIIGETGPHVIYMTLANEPRKRQLLGDALASDSAPNGLRSSIEVLRKAYLGSSLADHDNRILEMDLKTFLPDNILDYTDRMSMAAGLEVRVPFLDPAFVAMSLTSPFAHKVRNGNAKAILVDAFNDFFSPEARNAPKRGFNAPLGRWISQLFDPYFEASTGSSLPLRKKLGDDVGASWRDGILDFSFIQRLRSQHRHGQRDNSHELFACVIFDVWWRKYIKNTQPLAHWQTSKERMCASST